MQFLFDTLDRKRFLIVLIHSYTYKIKKYVLKLLKFDRLKCRCRVTYKYQATGSRPYATGHERAVNYHKKCEKIFLIDIRNNK